MPLRKIRKPPTPGITLKSHRRLKKGAPKVVKGKDEIKEKPFRPGSILVSKEIWVKIPP